ncbi:MULTISPECIES: hypothetical protein [Paenibacillus]|uniref:hypothetical protein n=1 Tax=Paenibacillus TaxID=44249 RepID=UPI00046606C5|nr:MULTISPECIES: hypothetical protein [Paenibacillus]KGP78129.1 hypothetical protein P364_0130220 [Paenibacillus sp. MAEPY2]KGP89349.1 hypothetical protein P363_0101430 [Paenibacillus sp. MAEPY1]OZQ71103.1 hypothetical protein CA599_11260 [Paenibacillus taichungensis]
MSKTEFDVSLFLSFFIPGILVTAIMISIYYLIGRRNPNTDRLWTYPMITFGIVAIVYAPIAAVT